MVDRRRYASHGRFGPPAAAKRQSGLPQLYRRRAASKDLYETDHVETRQGGRFRWLVSTCLAATVGAISLVVLYGSSDQRETAGGFLPALTQLDEADPIAFPRSNDGLKWSSPKSNRLKIASGSITTRYVVDEQVEQMRAGREYIQVSLLQSRPLYAISPKIHLDAYS